MRGREESKNVQEGHGIFSNLTQEPAYSPSISQLSHDAYYSNCGIFQSRHAVLLELAQELVQQLQYFQLCYSVCCSYLSISNPCQSTSYLDLCRGFGNPGEPTSVQQDLLSGLRVPTLCWAEWMWTRRIWAPIEWSHTIDVPCGPRR